MRPNDRQHPTTLLWFLLIAVITVAIYAQGLNGGFLFDDYPNIVDNKAVQPPHADLAALINAALSSPSSEFKRPVASLSFAVNFLANGLEPVAMKATNIAIHVLNGGLLFLLARSLMAFAYGRPRQQDTYTALVIAGGWLVLPINLTSVLYIVQRMESLANLFVLAGLCGYVAGRRRMILGRPGFAVAAGSVVVATVIGVLSKETAILLPLYAALLEFFLFKGRSANASTVVTTDHRMQTLSTHLDRRVLGFYVLTLFAPLIVGSAWLAPLALSPDTWSRRDFTLESRLLSEARIVIDYIGW